MEVVTEGGSPGSARLKGVVGGGGLGTDDRIKGPWSPEEDVVLNRLVEKFGARNWSLIARGIPGRSGKSCRLRWCNQLNPGVKRKPFTGVHVPTLPLLLLPPPLRPLLLFTGRSSVQIICQGGGRSVSMGVG